IIVMRAGQVVEAGTAEEIFYHPQHPYTKQLLDAVPHLGTGVEGEVFGSSLDDVSAVAFRHADELDARSAEEGNIDPHHDGSRDSLGSTHAGSATVAEGGANRTNDLDAESREIAEAGQPDYRIEIDSKIGRASCRE